MTTFVLVPGAGGSAWYWQRVVPLIERAGHEAIAVGLPAEDESAGLNEYADLIVGAAAGRDDVVLVGMSLGGFTVPMAAARRAVRSAVLVNAMIPVPGETAGQWWGNTGWAEAMRAAAEAGGYGPEFDEEEYFLHDVPPELLATGEKPRPEADAAFTSVCEFTDWPPVRAVAGADDRFFPPEFQRRQARDRLGIEADVLPGGHLMAVSRPDELATYLLASLTSTGLTS